MPQRRLDEHGNEILTTHEQLFVEGLMRGKKPHIAATQAGYSARTASEIASENLTKPAIQRAIQQRLDAIKADSNEVLSLLALHMRADFGDFDEDCWNEDGSINWKEAKRKGLSRLVKKVKRETRYVQNQNGQFEKVVKTEIELHDSQAAGWKLAEIAGLRQQARRNEHDRDEKQEYYERLIVRLIKEALKRGQQLSRQEAIEQIAQRDQQAAKYLMAASSDEGENTTTSSGDSEGESVEPG